MKISHCMQKWHTLKKKKFHGKVQQQAGRQRPERLINRNNKFRSHRCRVLLRRQHPHTRNKEDGEPLWQSTEDRSFTAYRNQVWSQILAVLSPERGKWTEWNRISNQQHEAKEKLLSSKSVRWSERNKMREVWQRRRKLSPPPLIPKESQCSRLRETDRGNIQPSLPV